MCIEAVQAQVDATTYPLAAAVVLGDEVLAVECSRLPSGVDPSAHPEMCAVRRAAACQNSRYLEGATLYSTVEPCPMCASVAIWARMKAIVFGLSQDEVIAYAENLPMSSMTWRQIRIPASVVAAAGTPEISVIGGVLVDECRALLALTADRARSSGLIHGG